MKTPTKFLAFFGVVFVALVLAELFRERPIDWRQTFSKDDKIPYGAFALYELLPTIFPGTQIEESDEPIYNRLKNKEMRSAAYIVVAARFLPDSLESAALLNFVQAGNTAFIAAETFSDDFRDTLGFTTDWTWEYSVSEDDTITLSLLNPSLDSAVGYKYAKNLANQYFRTYDTVSAAALGKNSHGQPTFLRVPFGKGRFFISTTPIAFTNYHLLNAATSGYIPRAFSYLSPKVIVWDEYYNNGRRGARTPLRFILQQEALRAAWYLLLAGASLFVLFRVKRRQRAIPVIAPPANTTLEFIRTVGRLYFERKNNGNILEKRVQYLLEFIRTRLNIPTSDTGADFQRRVAEKAGLAGDEVRDLFGAIGQAQIAAEISDEVLAECNRKIEWFYRSAQA